MRFLIITLFLTQTAIARDCSLPNQWHKLCSILNLRVKQTARKMKLQESSAKSLEKFLNATNYNFVYLPILQNNLPKTTLELLIAINKRGLDIKEADLIDFLHNLLLKVICTSIRY
ncbi:hypothetical protein [Rickettsia asembonensis]|uniref:Uncharacterized protein n=1 Tax=Rickettsia asembonensis TaxID=1068590 RepID=A0A0C2MNQ0_9RICK|nr:hypothetical protein [Rickettsia asembonensis]KIJ88836.1 hypothetical protein SB78_03255 [Rickettsia asembonensis]